MADRLTALRQALAEQNLAGFLVPMNDEFMGEYVPDSAKHLTWLTGFTGSAGMAIVLQDKAAFLTDGRYTLQAKAEVKGFELLNNGDMPPEKWLSAQTKEGSIGYDPKLHTLHGIKRFEKAAPGLKFVPVDANPINALWKDCPIPPASAVKIHPLKFAGESSADKRARIAKELTTLSADVAVLTASDSVCWLLNVRGNDVPYTPFVLAYALLESSGKATLYIDGARVSAEAKGHLGVDVTVKPPAALTADLEALSGKAVLYDPGNSPIWFYQQLKTAGARIIEAGDPCLAVKARKNPVELEGVRQAHIRDGLAETKFLYWMDKAIGEKQSLTELDIVAKLEEFRKTAEGFQEPSFPTIAGSGPNGAIVHYRVSEESNRSLNGDSIFLLDSGGQYPDGTTDITRTIAIGEPTSQMKDRFTRVLKGHIALARAVFPEGTTGSQLDALARQFLWKEGLDYDHGTGHGVGSYLSVHEGPQRISKRGGDAPLAPGMVVSNEPGYYKAGEYGIRIENLVAVKEAGVGEGSKKFLGFETITLVPIDTRLIDRSLLTMPETHWLNEYHRRIYETHAPHLSAEEAKWLKNQGNMA